MESDKFEVTCQGSPVKIGDCFVCDYGYETPIGKCTQVLTDGLMLAFRWGDLVIPSQHFVPYCRIKGRAQVGWFKKLIG